MVWVIGGGVLHGSPGIRFVLLKLLVVWGLSISICSLKAYSGSGGGDFLLIPMLVGTKFRSQGMELLVGCF